LALLVLQNKVECLSLASFFSLWVQYSGCSGFPRKFIAHEPGFWLFWITSEV
jgi:hypothetical protein